MLAEAFALLLARAASTSAVATAQPAASPPPAPPDEYVHTIVPGDTLIGLGNALLTRPRDWPALQRLNRIRNPRRLRPGAPLRTPINLLRHLPGVAEVDWVKGRVHTQRAGAAGLLALVGASLEPGTTLITEADAAVRLRLTGGAVVTVGELAHVTLVDLRQFPAANSTRTLIGLQRGRLQQDVPPRRAPGQRHEIRTPVVTTAVRGTQFRVGVDEIGRSAVTEVIDGDVVVGRAADVAGRTVAGSALATHAWRRRAARRQPLDCDGPHGRRRAVAVWSARRSAHGVFRAGRTRGVDHDP